MRFVVGLFIAQFIIHAASAQPGTSLQQDANTWVKRSPLKGGPPSPMLGYEGSFGYDTKLKLLVRWAGHNQGGGGEQNAETWTYDPATAKWTLKEPNTSPPGACCNAQNLFDPVTGRFLRFPAFSGSHGWHWFRENYLSNTSVWSYDIASNTWRDMRPVPTLHPRPLRCASWDSDHEVVVIFGGEGSNDGTIVYDPYDNSWRRMQPKKEPASRSAGNMAYHKSMKRHILFGTQFSDDPHTWAYDLTKNEWTDLKPTTMPPTDKNDAVLAYDEFSDVIVASVRAQGKVEGDDGWHYETWVYEHTKNTWTKMNPKAEPPGGGQRRRIMAAIPDENVILMENYINPPQRVPGVDREQQIWTYRYGFKRAKTAISAPHSAIAKTQELGVLLTWSGQSDSQWHIVRRVGKNPWDQREEKSFTLQGDANKPTAFLDDDAKPRISYTYAIHAVNANGEKSAPALVRTQPKLVEDVVASVHSATKVEIHWPAGGALDISGYLVERAPVEVLTEDEIIRLRKDTTPLESPSVGAIKSIGKFERVTKSPVKEASFIDTTLDLSKPVNVADAIYRHRFTGSQLFDTGKSYRFAVYAYRVRAVNKVGVESGAGPFVLTIPSSPKAVFAKEDGVKCHLKWEANPEAGIAGYRVYRMESPRINGAGQPVTRVTADPVKENRFLDTNKNKDTRRYWIVAVDALGQEGIPSAPVWFERQYKNVYKTFTGEWHQ